MLHNLPRRLGSLLPLALVALATLAMPAALYAGGPATHAAPHALGYGLLALGGLALGTSAAASSASPFYGLLPDSLIGKDKRTYVAPLNWTPLAAGAAGVVVELTADANHDVVFHRLSYTARDNATLAMLDRPRILADLSLASGWEFTTRQNPVELENLAGINRGAPELAIPLVVPAGETFRIALTNPGAAAILVQVALIGFRSVKASR
jgi:hypothetical protein